MQAKVVEGAWSVTSKIVASNCPSVAPGTVVESFIQYLKNAQGAIVQNWQETGWTPASSNLWKLGDWTFSTNKESSFQTPQGNVIARSQEKMKVVSPKVMVAESTVQQYLNGKFIPATKPIRSCIKDQVSVQISVSDFGGDFIQSLLKIFNQVFRRLDAGGKTNE